MIDPGAGEEPFAKQIARSSLEHSSRIVLALDIQEASSEATLRRAQRLLDQTRRYVCAVKLHRYLILRLGARRTRLLIRETHRHEIPIIVDDKLNDIGSTNTAIADAYFQLGVDALIANPFVGWKGGLEPLFKTAHQRGKGVILLVYMSHPAASEGYGQKVVDGRTVKPQYLLFARKAKMWKADGAVVGATRPDIIREAKQFLRSTVPIYSPGVGVQGGTLQNAANAGTDYFIVGRSIIDSSAPGKVAGKLALLSTRTAA